MGQLLLTFSDEKQSSSNMHKHIQLLLVLGLFSCLSFALPVVDNPYLNIKINREDNGVKSGFDSAVSKAVQNLIVSGPPAPEIDFRGEATYYQKAFPHTPPFLAFKGYQS